MPKLGKVRQDILNDLKVRALALYEELGDLRLVGKAVGKSHTWVASVLKEVVHNQTLQKLWKGDTIKQGVDKY